MVQDIPKLEKYYIKLSDVHHSTSSFIIVCLCYFLKGNMFGHYIMVNITLLRIIVPHDPSALFLNLVLKQNYDTEEKNRGKKEKRTN